MHDNAVTGRCELLLFKDFLQLTMNVYIYIYRFAGLDYSANLHIALVYLLSTLIADEIFTSLYYYIIYIYMYFWGVQNSHP